MNAIVLLELKKKTQDKGLWFWTFLLPIIFIVGFITLFGESMGAEPEQLVVQIVPGYTVMFSFYIMISIVIAFIKDRDSGMTARIGQYTLVADGVFPWQMVAVRRSGLVTDHRAVRVWCSCL